jgi:phytoene/squalene synthetase
VPALSIPFTLRRPWLMLSQWLTDRDRPDLDRLRALADPERFVWAMLPHAARTFASCIALLPSDKARAAAVGYLYCRVLDTYEDLAAQPGPLLDAFAARFEAGRLIAAPPQLVAPHVQDMRDRAHLLLVECVDRVDAVYARLSPVQRESIARCVRAMALGMKEGNRDVLAYCRTVIGHPVVFALELLLERRLDPGERETAMRVGEMVQLANITRDVEKDHSRGVIYDARLAGQPDEATIRAVRTDLMRLALERTPDYRRLMAMLRRPRFRLGRSSALLMLLFTSRYYDACARRLGYEGWSAPRSTAGFFVRVIPAAFSHRYAMRSSHRIERAIAGFVGAGTTSGIRLP